MRVVSALGVVFLVGCAATGDASREESPSVPTVRVAFLPARAAPWAGSRPMTAADGRVVYVGDDAIVTERDIVGARVADHGGRPSLFLALSDEAAARMQEATSRNIGHALAIVIDGDLVSAPRIMSAVGQQAVVTGDLDRDWLVDVARRLNHGAGR